MTASERVGNQQRSKFPSHNVNTAEVSKSKIINKYYLTLRVGLVMILEVNN